jgi:hypothetical protein
MFVISFIRWTSIIHISVIQLSMSWVKIMVAAPSDGEEFFDDDEPSVLDN